MKETVQKSDSCCKYFRCLFGLIISLFSFSQVVSQTYKFSNPLDIANNGVITIRDIPDGNYHITIEVGSSSEKGHTVIRGESRRLFFNAIETKKGVFKKVSFTINKRNTLISDNEMVKIKERERNKLNWDNHLTLEFAGLNPKVSEMEVRQVTDVTTIFLCGNSTVVDQDNEPWASWGQIIPAYFNEQVSFANYAESGESANTFVAALRLKKIMSVIKPGDYVFIEFGHNDQKQTGEGKGPYLHYYNTLLQMVTETREKGGFPVLLTPTQRRSFNNQGKIIDTHGEYPEAMRKLAADLKVPLIDLHSDTRILYEALGEENSKRAFVHYPANTFTNQPIALEDNTHFNAYGANLIAKCVIEGIIKHNLPIKQYLRKGHKGWSPSKPGSYKTFKWYPGTFIDLEKPDGN